MAYNPNYPYNFQQAYPPYTQLSMFQQPQMSPTNMSGASNSGQQNTNIVWVQGEAAAKSYAVAPNSSIPLWDSESQTIYLKSADMNGMPSIKILDYTIRENPTPLPNKVQSTEYVTKEEFDSIKAELSALKSKIEPKSKTSSKEAS